MGAPERATQRSKNGPAIGYNVQMLRFLGISRLRQFVVPVLLIAPAVFACGKLLLTPVWRQMSEWEFNRITGDWSGPPLLRERGWPWVFAIPDGITDPSFSLGLLVADIVVLLGLVATFGLLLTLHRRRRGRWLSISLRELFALTTVVACAAGWWMYHARLAYRAGQTANQFLKEPWFSGEGGYCGPEWLHRLLPEEYLGNFMHQTALRVRENSSLQEDSANRDRFLSALRALPFLRQVEFQPGDFEWLLRIPANRDRSVPAATPDPDWLSTIDVSAFERIEEIDFTAYFVDDDVLAVLARLPRLVNLRAGGAFVTDRGIEHLMRRDSLQRLDLHTTSITDVGVARLAKSTCLHVLLMDSTQITDDALASLAKLRTLEELDIRQCGKITEGGVKQLLTLPNLKYLAIRTTEETSPQTLVLLHQRIPHVSVGSY